MEKQNKTESDYKVLRFIREGANLVNEDNLLPVVEFLEGQGVQEAAADDFTLDMSR